MAVTISSMGVVDPKSLMELRTIMGYNNRELQKVVRQMPDAAITGSLKIRRHFAQNIEPKPPVDAEEAMVTQQEQADAIEMDDNGKIESAQRAN
jgi:hypothetical protein